MATLEMPRNYVRLWKLSHRQRTGVGPLRMTVILLLQNFMGRKSVIKCSFRSKDINSYIETEIQVDV